MKTLPVSWRVVRLCLLVLSFAHFQVGHCDLKALLTDFVTEVCDGHINFSSIRRLLYRRVQPFEATHDVLLNSSLLTAVRHHMQQSPDFVQVQALAMCQRVQATVRAD